MIPLPDDPFAQQNPFEFRQWLGLVRGRSLLEVGSCYGQTLAMMARRLPRGSRIVSVDLGEGQGKLRGTDTGNYLKREVEKLALEGYDAHLIFGDSHNPKVVEQVRRLGPFDVGFIDGDHTYEGVRQDWENYGPLCEVVGFHDVFHTLGGSEVPRLWQELKEQGRPYMEIKNSNMGIGVIFGPNWEAKAVQPARSDARLTWRMWLRKKLMSLLP